MKKKGIISIIIIVGLITSALIVLGVVYDKDEFEKQQGRTAVFDVSADGTIAYVYYDEGQPGIYLENGTADLEQPMLQLENDREISDISF
ncbi:hypothetical protein [Oceanobacillus halotolerans]|uniref:hypothetical protein n=1 Tax=Oceanobacillus halotolerans TaxID=2663380 RepID=UPI0013D91C54|nr:hypothetical protein [Oceanobacillus halotolerans]